MPRAIGFLASVGQNCRTMDFCYCPCENAGMRMTKPVAATGVTCRLPIIVTGLV